MLGYRILRKPTHQARKSCGNIEEFTDKTTRNRGNQTLSPKHEVHRTTSNKNMLVLMLEYNLLERMNIIK